MVMIASIVGQRCSQLTRTGRGHHEQFSRSKGAARLDGVGPTHPRGTVKREAVFAGDDKPRGDTNETGQLSSVAQKR